MHWVVLVLVAAVGWTALHEYALHNGEPKGRTATVVWH
jgi:hypothetical protein